MIIVTYNVQLKRCNGTFKIYLLYSVTNYAHFKFKLPPQNYIPLKDKSIQTMRVCVCVCVCVLNIFDSLLLVSTHLLSLKKA